MARSEEASRRRAEKRNRTEQDQRKADARDLEKGEERESKKRTQKVRGEKDENNGVVSRPADQDVDVVKAVGGLHRYEQILTGLLGGENNNAETKKSNTAIMQKTAGEEEQTVVDSKNSKEKNGIINDPALKEPGSWICKGCNNHNFASRHVCHSKTCDERRPAGVHVPPRFQFPASTYRRDPPASTYRRDPTVRLTSGLPTLNPKSRHDPTTSKTMKWAEQASTETLEKNQDLRKRYMETKGEGMEEADVARAKLLLERDERKKQKKELRKKGKGRMK